MIISQWNPLKSVIGPPPPGVLFLGERDAVCYRREKNLSYRIQKSDP